MTKDETQIQIESIGTIAAGIDLTAAVIENLVGNGITGKAKAGVIEADLSSEAISLVATRMNAKLKAKKDLNPSNG